MDYIMQKINQRINFLEGRNERDKLRLYYQVKLEYELLILLAYLWNKNYEKLNQDVKEYIVNKINQPSIGQIVEINRKLDVEGEIFTYKKVNKIINNYPKFRNEKIGHGYSFEDDSQQFIELLREMTEEMSKEIGLLNKEYSFILVEREINGVYEGIAYKSNGEYDNWMYRKKKDIKDKIEVGILYLQDDELNYFKVSPFILINSEMEIYTFRSVAEKLLGKFLYNRLFTTGTVMKEWKFFKELNIACDEFKRVGSNGTIINLFENNYSEHKYIENNTIKKELEIFLNNNSFVCATLWGHGGVGKTATVQNLCEELQLKEQRRFDYILFISAKDRYYDYHLGKVNCLDCDTSYVNIIKSLHRLIKNEEIFDEDTAINCDARYLLVIDDFETFSQADKSKIQTFITKLDVKKHKVIITTRSNSIIGYEIKTNELDEENTAIFLIEVFKKIFERDITSKLNDVIKKRVHSITSGRPIFILQFAYVFAQRGIEYATEIDFKNSTEAIEFLYGRIYEYLNPSAQKIFAVMGVVADSEDMTNLIEKIKYILNMENDTQFESNIAEIEKLRLVEIIDSKFYKIYSKEIYDIMKKYFEELEENYRGNLKGRMLQVSKDKHLNNDNALLANANASRYSKNEQEVVSLYRQILNRKTSTLEIKLSAILNLSEYLFNDRGNKDYAVEVLEEYYFEFQNEPIFIKVYATYSWAKGFKEKAVDLLLGYFSTKTNFKEMKNVELFGMLITYRSLYWLELREETKEGYKYKEITEEEYKEQLFEQKNNFEDIAKKQGHILIEYVKNNDFRQIPSATRQSLITALYQYTEICIRLQDWDIGKFICNFVGNKLAKYNYGLDFESKLKRIKVYEKNSKS